MKTKKDPLAYIQPDSPRAEENLTDSIGRSGDSGTPIKAEIKNESDDLFVLPKTATDSKDENEKIENEESEVGHLPLDSKLLPIPTIAAESSLNEGTVKSYAHKTGRLTVMRWWSLSIIKLYLPYNFTSSCLKSFRLSHH